MELSLPEANWPGNKRLGFVYSVPFAECRLFVACVDVVGPRGAKVRVAPAVLQAGSNATLTCVTESANPAARVSWWTTSQDGRLQAPLATVIVRESQRAAEYGGSVVVSRAEVVLDSDDDWRRVACVANGTRTETRQVQLRVRCKSRVSVTLSTNSTSTTIFFVDSFTSFE